MKKKKPKCSLRISRRFLNLTNEITLEEENMSLTSTTLDITTGYFIIKEMRVVIKNLDSKKTLVYDLITNQILQKLPKIEIKYNGYSMNL